MSNNIERAKKGETFTFTDGVKLDGKTIIGKYVCSSQRKKLIEYLFYMDITRQLQEIENERLIYQDMLTVFTIDVH